MIYQKLKRTWTHSYANYIPDFNNKFPELKKISREEMCDRFQSLDIDFYTQQKKPVNLLIRLTLPFAAILALLMIISLPFVFTLTGNWYYTETKKPIIKNWFKKLFDN